MKKTNPSFSNMLLEYAAELFTQAKRTKNELLLETSAALVTAANKLR